MSRNTLRDNIGHVWYYRLLQKNEDVEFESRDNSSSLITELEEISKTDCNDCVKIDKISNSNTKHKGINDLQSNKSNIKTKGLLDYHPPSTLDGKLIVSSDYRYQSSMKSKTGSKIFTFFDSFIDFGHYFFKLMPEHRTFYEVAIGDHCQKPHFDIDVNSKLWDEHSSLFKSLFKNNDIDIISFAEIIKDLLIEGCIYLFKTLWNIDLSLERDLLLYSSHTEDKSNDVILKTIDGNLIDKPKPSIKRSYHLVINNYCHTRNSEAKNFYNKVITWIIERIKSMNTDCNSKKESFTDETQTRPNIKDLLYVIIDHNVYSSKQNFRIIGCCKSGTDRYKKFNTNYLYHGRLIKHQYPKYFEFKDLEQNNNTMYEREVSVENKYLFIVQLEESLISYTKSCTILPDLIPVTETQYRNHDIDINDDLIKRSMICFVKYYEKLIGIKNLSLDSENFPFRYLSLNGSLICLRRIKSSYCEICFRRHENENPYLLLVKSNFGDYYLYYHCRRAPKDKKIFVGTIRETKDRSPTIIDKNIDNCGTAVFEDEEDEITPGFYSNGKLINNNTINSSNVILTNSYPALTEFNNHNNIFDSRSVTYNIESLNGDPQRSTSLEIKDLKLNLLDSSQARQKDLNIELDIEQQMGNPTDTVNDVISLSSYHLVKKKKDLHKNGRNIRSNSKNTINNCQSEKKYKKELIDLIAKSL